MVTERQREGGSAPSGPVQGAARALRARSLFRFVHVPGHTPVHGARPGRHLGGHGAWVHPRRECLSRAVRGGFSRVFKAQVTVDRGELLEPCQ